MKIITLPQLRMAQLQRLTESILPIVRPLAEVGSQVQQIEEAFAIFQDGMIKTTTASDKRTMDRSRDHLIAGLLYSIQAEQHFPHTDDAVKEALARVAAIANKYGFDLNRLSYSEQTAQTDNLLEELTAADLSALEHLARWIAPVRAANEAFKETAGEYLDSQIAASGTASASASAPALEEALRALFTMLFAHRQIAGNEQLDRAYIELETLVATYR